MALRQLEIHLPEVQGPLPPLEEEFNIVDRWDLTLDNGNRLIRVLVETKDTEALLEWLQEEFGDVEGYRIVVIGVAATVPRQGKKKDDEDEKDNEEGENGEDKEKKSNRHEVSRISREEVYQEVDNSISVTKIHYTLVALSTVVAVGGMMRNSPAVVIGAMVIAPLIGPNIALALGTTLADFDLLKRSVKVNFFGLFIALVLAIISGMILPIDISVPEIASRTEINIGDVALALAAGVAGVLSVTRGVSTALIGVMVAVALLPPLVAMGLMAGTGEWVGAYGAALLTLTNIVAINLAGVITFLVQGIRPLMWYEEKRARKARFIAIGLWISMLAILVLVITLVPPAPI